MHAFKYESVKEKQDKMSLVPTIIGQSTWYPYFLNCWYLPKCELLAKYELLEWSENARYFSLKSLKKTQLEKLFLPLIHRIKY